MTVTVTKVHSVPALGDATPSSTRTKRIHLLVNGISDATADLTDSIAIDLSAYLGPLGETPTRLSLRRLSWSIAGFTSINLEFDRGTDSIVAQMAGIDYKDFPNYLPDVGTGGTGDLVFTTVGATAGGTFSLEIEAKLKY